MILTRELLHIAASDYVGWNRSQLDLLGVKWPPSKGWLSNLVGTYIDDDKWHQLMAISGVRGKKKQKAILLGQKTLF